ncbi:MAG: tetratricopeptide repeat protein [Candidatus Rokubacteria bacterium]|nr:tetratricopeptide repeat protein [Candidatus Rokubacteria bacterium]
MRRLAIVLSLALLLGCQSPTPGPAPVGSLTVRLKAEGDALAARGDYEAAAVKYQQAANQEPEDVRIRFALGSALSHLGRREETVEQFRFVVARGKPDSAEVQAARRWLIAAGELTEGVTFAPSAIAQPGAPPAATAATPPVPGGKVRGRAEARGQPREITIVMSNQDEAKRDMAFTKTLKLGEAFSFDDVPPGTYRLLVEDTENDSQLWDVEVTVASGKETVLDLK